MFIAVGVGEFIFLLAIIVVLLGAAIVDVVETARDLFRDGLSWLVNVGPGNSGRAA